MTLPCLVEQTPSGQTREDSEGAIANDRELLYDTVATSILWNIGDTGLNRVSRRVDQALFRLPPDPDRAGVN